MKVRPVTDFPMDEEDINLYGEYGDALERGDHEAAHRAFAKIKLAPPTLLAIKRVEGAEVIRERGYNTTLADQEFGPDWLDRDDDDWQY